VFQINGADGKLEEVFEYGRRITSCDTSIIARGWILSGDLHEDRTVARSRKTRVSTGQARSAIHRPIRWLCRTNPAQSSPRCKKLSV